ncbi:Uncharacterized protein At3g49140 [Linum grandiflorum]
MSLHTLLEKSYPVSCDPPGKRLAGEEVVGVLNPCAGRCKGIRVEEAEVVRVDSFGFDLSVCSGTQVPTLRFAFKSRVKQFQTNEFVSSFLG